MPWWIAAGAAIVVATATTLWWLWWRLPKRQVDGLRLQIRDAKARADLEDSFRKTIGQLIGGAAVLTGAGFAYYQTLLTQKASYDQLISQQVSKGFEQLGSDKVAVRLGGIYALEGVMNTSEQYHKPVLEALCAFVRDGTESTAPTAQPVHGKTGQYRLNTGPSPERPSPATDIQAALTVIGRRTNKTDRADLSYANLPGADLRMAELNDAGLTGANLSGAYLAEANLTWAMLAKTNLRGAALFGAKLNHATLSKADLKGTILTGADLTDANVSQDQLNEACGGATTKLPSGLAIKTCPIGGPWP